MVHNEFLEKICKESDLKGLVYHGGPKVVCECCEWSGILHCVDYPDEDHDVDHPDDDHNIDHNPRCDRCNHQYNADEMLNHQVIKP